MVARTSSWRQPANVPPKSSRLYFGCVIGLSTFFLLAYLWPQTPHIERVQCVIEVTLSPGEIEEGLFKDLLEESFQACLEKDVLDDIVSLSSASFTQLESSLGIKRALPTEQEQLGFWLKHKVTINEVGGSTVDYRLVELTGTELRGDLAAILLNQLATRLTEKLNRKIIFERLAGDWLPHQQNIEDTLRYRRQWMGELRGASGLQAQVLQQIATQQIPKPTSPPTQLASAKTVTPTAKPPRDRELLLAEIKMRQEQLLALSNQHTGPGRPPEFETRLRQIEQLQQLVGESGLALPPETSDVKATRVRVEENQFYLDKTNPSQVNRSSNQQAEFIGLVDQAQDANNQIFDLQAEAESRLKADEKRTTEIREWIDSLSLGSAPSSLQIIKFARQQPRLPSSIPSSHWIFICSVSIILGGGLSTALAFRPMPFQSSADVESTLGVEVLGVIPAEPTEREPLVAKIKRHESKLKIAAELTVLIMTSLVVLSLFQDPRLLPLLLENPFEGVAQALRSLRSL
ncbi:MAG: hypothetical protein VX111_07330 [Planctomycetota bacterium]|nr:hypothetical protein [Planctomycetota bacterium]